MVAKEQKVAEVRVSRCIDLLGLSSQLGFILSNVSFVNKLAPTRISFFFLKKMYLSGGSGAREMPRLYEASLVS